MRDNGKKQFVVTGAGLLEHCEDARARGRVRTFLFGRGDQAGHSLARNVMVLRGNLGSYLSVREGIDRMPMIQRTGRYPPSMVIPALDEVSTNGGLQRLGTPYITLKEAVKQITKHVRELVHNWGEKASPSTFKDSECTINLWTQLKEKKDTILDPESEKQLSDWIYERLRPEEDSESADDANPILDSIRLIVRHAWDPKTHTTEESIDKAERTDKVLDQLLKSQVHLWKLISKLDEHAHDVVVQGCGDISMNFWNVAWVRKHDPEELIHVPLEPLDEREYSCLVNWDSTSDDTLLHYLKKKKGLFHAGWGANPQLSIGRVRFRQYDENKVRLLHDEGVSEVIDEKARFVLYGQKMVWDGKPVQPRDIIMQCSDVRHVLKMPNLNPTNGKNDKEKKKRKEEWGALIDKFFGMEESPWKIEDLKDFLGKPASTEQLVDLLAPWQQIPRTLFGLPSDADVWLGEAVFLEQGALLQTACEHPVELPLWALGAPMDWVTACLLREDYEFVTDRDAVTRANQFSWDVSDRTNVRLVWQPRHSSYPCTMVGVGQLHPEPAIEKTGLDGGTTKGTPNSKEENGDGNWGDLFLLAWGHEYDTVENLSIFDCAQVLVDLGAEAVLLIDEGQDVFQQYFRDKEDLKKRFRGGESGFEGWDRFEQEKQQAFRRVPIKRDRIRGCLSFWIEQGAGTSKGAKSSIDANGSLSEQAHPWQKRGE